MRILERLGEAWRKSGRGTRVAIIVAVAAGFQILGALTLGTSSVETPAGATVVSYNEFVGMMEKGRIKEATVTPDTVKALDADGRTLVLNHDRWLYDRAFLKDLGAAGVAVKFPDVPADSLMTQFLRFNIKVVMPLATTMLFVGIGFILMMQMRHLITPGWPNLVRNVTVRFSDVAGQDEPKFELEEIKTFLKSPADYERLGAKAPRGVLLVGPPGTGKTLLAKALAGEASANFIAVTGSDFSAMFVGVGRGRVEKLFREARRMAPCIIFIDEIDSLARKRGGSGSDVAREQDTTLNQLLVEMDGFKTSDGVIVVAATNRIDVLDPALLRPGRFDRHVQVGLPTLSDRRAILDVHVKDRALAADVDLDHVARGTPGFSGADIQNIVNEASILAAREKGEEISARHFEEARDKIIMGLRRASMALDDEEKRLIAIHEAGHALVACHCPASDPVHQATIIPRGRSLGLVMRLPDQDRVITRRSRLEADLTVLMAGRAAEALVLGEGEVSNGADSDIEEATKIARKMVTRWGFSPVIGMVNVVHEDGTPDPLVEGEVRKFIAKSYERATDLLRENRPELDALAAELLDKETLSGDAVRAIVHREVEKAAA